MRELIEKLIVQFDLSPAQINNGYCADFATAIYDSLPVGRVTITDTIEAGGDETKLGWHVWAIVDGKHFDAACPEGVEDWKDLPIWRT